MKVYVVEEGGYEWENTVGVFSTVEKAKEHMDKLTLKHAKEIGYGSYGLSLITFELDVPKEELGD